MSEREPSPDDWFKRMVVDKLRDLAEGQKAIEASQQVMHAANQAKAEEVAKSVNAKVDEVVAAVNMIKLEVHSFQLVRQVVFAGIGTVLLAIVGALLALVLKAGKVW
jgi:hypothetical protein